MPAQGLRERGSPRRVTAICTVVAGLITLVGCVAPARDPEIAGVVTAIEKPRAFLDRFILSSGQSVEIDYNGRSHQLLEGTGPVVGRLLLAGHDRDGVWYAGLEQRTPDCYVLPTGGHDTGDFIVSPVGIRFRKAANFDPRGGIGGRFAEPFKGFCVNPRGEVTCFGVYVAGPGPVECGSDGP